MLPIFVIVVSRRGPAARETVGALARPAAAAVLGWLAATVVVHLTASNVVAILVGGTVLVAVYLLLAAPLAELLTLPRRLLRFEPATDDDAPVPAVAGPAREGARAA
jgi:hypothetical protein